MDTVIRSARRGQSLVEFAIILPVLLMLTVVIFDLGRVVYYYSALHNAAREGVRYGAATPLKQPFVITVDVNGMKNAAKNYAIGLGLKNPNITYAGYGPSETIHDFANPTVEVDLSYEFTPATPVLPNLLGLGQITLNSYAVMRTEWLPVP